MKKLSHGYVNSSNSVEFMYFHRVTVNFMKTASNPLYQLHLLVDIPQDGADLQTYPQNFTGCYIVRYGIIGTESDLDADNIYDYHTLYKPDVSTAMTKNADLYMNDKKITNVSVDYNDNYSIASVTMVKDLSPYTRDYIYRSIVGANFFSFCFSFSHLLVIVYSFSFRSPVFR